VRTSWPARSGAELVELARRQVGWTEADAAEHGDTAVLRAAGFEETPFDDLSLEDQAAWLDAHPQEAERMEREVAVQGLMDRYNGQAAVDSAEQAAMLGVRMEDIEAEFERRGVEHVKASQVPAAQQVYEQAKGGEEG
jgi:hypothetical protein